MEKQVGFKLSQPAKSQQNVNTHTDSVFEIFFNHVLCFFYPLQALLKSQYQSELVCVKQKWSVMGQVDRLSESHSSGDDLKTTCDTVV